MRFEPGKIRNGMSGPYFHIVIFQAVLGESKATSGRNIVEVESNDYGKKTLNTPICSLSFGEREMVGTDVSKHLFYKLKANQ